MEFIKVDETNLDKEHICCAISDKKGETGVASKKAWMKECFSDGLVFLKLNERGKVFIERDGPVIYYSNQCPHTDKYAPLLENASNQRGIPLELKRINSREAARNAPTPFPTYSFFLDGKFVTSEILTEKKFFEHLEAAEYL